MIICQNCGFQNKENANFCKKCGQPLNYQPKIQKPLTKVPTPKKTETTSRNIYLILIVAIIVIAIAGISAAIILTSNPQTNTNTGLEDNGGSASSENGGISTTSNDNSGSSSSNNGVSTSTYVINDFTVNYPSDCTYQKHTDANKVSFHTSNGGDLGYIEYVSQTFSSASAMANFLSNSGYSITNYEDTTFQGYPGAVIHATYNGNPVTFHCFVKSKNTGFICTMDNVANSNLLYETFTFN